MKTYCLTTMIVVFMLLHSNGLKVQDTQTESPKAGPEYDVLDAWVGTWTFRAEQQDSISGPWYQVDWILKGKRILNGYAIEIDHIWKGKGIVQYGTEVAGYDPIKKTCMCHIFYDDGTWENSIPVFTDKRICIENGELHYTNGKIDTWRTTWNFSTDWKSATFICENLIDNRFCKVFEGKGTKIEN